MIRSKERKVQQWKIKEKRVEKSGLHLVWTRYEKKRNEALNTLYGLRKRKEGERLYLNYIFVHNLNKNIML